MEGHADKILSLAFAPDGTVVASGSRDGTTKLWDVADGGLIRTIEGSCVAFSPDGTMVIASSPLLGDAKLRGSETIGSLLVRS